MGLGRKCHSGVGGIGMCNQKQDLNRKSGNFNYFYLQKYRNQSAIRDEEGGG